jgi:hypothetical protein
MFFLLSNFSFLFCCARLTLLFFSCRLSRVWVSCEWRKKFSSNYRFIASFPSMALLQKHCQMCSFITVLVIQTSRNFHFFFLGTLSSHALLSCARIKISHKT